MPRHNEHWGKGDRRGGQFAPKGKGGRVEERSQTALRRQPAPELEQMLRGLRQLPDADFERGLAGVRAMPEGEPKRLLLAKLANELSRRRRARQRTAEQEARAVKVGQLIEAGWDFADAYAEVHGIDPARIAREQVDAVLDRRPGESRSRAMRRVYAERVLLEYDQAEEATNGNVLSKAGRAAGVSARSLWSSSPDVARKYASKELLAWWEERGGRLTFVEFRGQLEGGQARQDAKASRSRGAARDYGT